MGRLGYRFTIAHDRGTRSSNELTQLVEHYFEDFWNDARGGRQLHPEYEYETEVVHDEGRSQVIAWFSDWGGTRNASSELAVHLLEYYLFCRRGEIRATLGLAHAVWNDNLDEDRLASPRTQGPPVFLRANGAWGHKQGGELVLDDAQTAPLPDGQLACECWGCTTAFDADARGHSVEVARRAGADWVEKVRGIYLGFATPTAEDLGGKLESIRAEVLRDALLAGHDDDLWALFHANLQQKEQAPKVARSLHELLMASRNAGLPEHRLISFLDLWKACLDHSDPDVHRLALAAAEGLYVPERKHDPEWTTESTVSRLQELLESGPSVVPAAIDRAGRLLFRFLGEVAYPRAAELLCWARQHDDPRLRAASASWGTVRPQVSTLADELQLAGVDIEVDYPPPDPSLGDAYTSINAHLAEMVRGGVRTRQTAAYKALRKEKGPALGALVVACEQLARALYRDGGDGRTAEDITAGRDRAHVLDLRNAVAKLKRTILTREQLEAVLRGEPRTVETWTPEFTTLAERSLERHGSGPEILDLVRLYTENARTLLDPEVQTRVRALLVVTPSVAPIPGLVPGEADWSDRALATVGGLPSEEAACWAKWLTHISTWKTRKGAKAKAWTAENGARLAELGEEKVFGAIASWFASAPTRPLPEANAHLATGLLWAASDASHPTAVGALSAALRICHDRLCEKHWRAGVTALLGRDTIDAYLAYFETGRPALLERGRQLKRLLVLFEKKERPLARALAAAAGKPAERETVDRLTTLVADQLVSFYYESERLPLVAAHVRTAPPGVSPDAFRRHADRLIRACQPTDLATWIEVMKLRRSVEMELEPREVVRVALFELERPENLERMSWVIDEELCEHVVDVTRERFSRCTDDAVEIGMDFSSALITRRQLNEAVALLDLVLEVAEHADLHYNLACAWTLRSDLDMAMKAIERSIELNPSNKQDAATDDELAALRADPRFAEL